MNHKTITGIVVAVLIAGAVYFIVNDQKNKKVEIRARQYATQEMCEASTGKHCVVGTCEGKKDTCPYGFSPWVPNPQSTTQQPTPTPTPTPKDETANWKTYNNTEFSYEVKYPNNWEVSQTGMQVSFMAIGGQDVFLTFFVYNKPINEAEALLPLLSVPERKIDSRTNITINGINWVKLVVEKNQIAQLTYHNNRTYAAQYSTFENLSPQILSTFKFTKSTITVPVVTVKDLNNNPSPFLNTEVRVTGKLINIGQSYFNNPIFVLSDGMDNFLVSMWLPLEVPPPIPGSTGGQPPTMATYLDKSITLQGVVKKDSQSRFYLDVIEIK